MRASVASANWRFLNDWHDIPSASKNQVGIIMAARAFALQMKFPPDISLDVQLITPSAGYDREV